MLKFGFYNSDKGDRRYNAIDVSTLFDGIIKDGVFMDIGQRFYVSPNPDQSKGLSVIVNSGKAWFNNTWTINDSQYVVKMPDSGIRYPRYDSIVLTVNKLTRQNTIEAVRGPDNVTPSGEIVPIPPSLIDNTNVHQHRLANILIEPGTMDIKIEDITTVVGTSECPYVTGVIQTINTDEIIRQWLAEIDTTSKEFEQLVKDFNKEVKDLETGAAVVLKKGDHMEGTLDMRQNKIVNVPDPKEIGDASNKGWVEKRPLSTFSQDASNRTVSDTEKETWNNKQPAGDYATKTELNTGLDEKLNKSPIDIATEEDTQAVRRKEDGSLWTKPGGGGTASIEEIDARVKIHNESPDSHPEILNKINELEYLIPQKLSDLESDASHRTVTDAEKSDWNGKQPAGDYVIIASNSGSHNAIYRGRRFVGAPTTEQYKAIKDGTFKDLFIGDYWSIGGVNWRIAGFDYFYHAGEPACNKHHAVIVPDSCRYLAKMNNTYSVTGGYVGSAMYKTNLESDRTTIKNNFVGHVLQHSLYLTNAVANGQASAGLWVDREVDIMCEQMLFGSGILSPVSNGNTVPANCRVEKSQLPLFTFRPDMILANATYWLRDVISTNTFASVNANGLIMASGAGDSYGVRPVFAIYGGA